MINYFLLDFIIVSASTIAGLGGTIRYIKDTTGLRYKVITWLFYGLIEHLYFIILTIELTNVFY